MEQSDWSEFTTMVLVSHESVGVVAFSLWAAFELHLERRDRYCGRVSFGCHATTRSLVDPVPNESLLGDPGEFVASERDR